jgi:hypothetical protein
MMKTKMIGSLRTITKILQTNQIGLLVEANKIPRLLPKIII